jgi:ribonuclease VapC
MIVIDTSALIAILRQEPERDAFADAITDANRRMLPAHVYLEYVMVTSREPQARVWLDALIERLPIATAHVDHAGAQLAADAFLRYGRGRGHPARLNLSDCLSYAVAKHLGAPLLYKGDDFSHTDIESALPQ